MYYRQEMGGKYHSTFTETRVRAPLIDILLVLSDVSNYKSWVSVVSESTVLAEVSPLKQVSHLKASLPKPLSNR